MHLVKAFGDDGVDSGATVVAAREKGGARRGAGCGARVEVGEAHATGCQLVEDRSLDRTAITAEVAVAEVVDKEGDDVGLFVRGKSRANQQDGAQKCEYSHSGVSAREGDFRESFFRPPR